MFVPSARARDLSILWTFLGVKTFFILSSKNGLTLCGTVAMMQPRTKQVKVKMIIPRSDRVMLFPHDGADPPEGFYGVTLGRGHLERAMRIYFYDGLWHVTLDGDLFADPNADWREAFGRLGKREILLGRKVNTDQYLQLLRDRLRDVLEGRDIDKPVDLNSIPVRF